jgi:outer membrane protein assembly factor BamB
MITVRKRAFRMGSLCAVVACGAAFGADWPGWRGPNHDGIYLETGLKTDWTQKPKTLWQYPAGSAFSSFACVGGKVYTCGTKDKKQVLFCFQADSDKVIWARPFAKEYRERQGGDGTRATPTVDDGRVYVFGPYGTLLCLDAEKGDEIWKKRFSNRPIWGYSGSVLIEGNLAIVSPGAKDGALLALDKKTGKEIWRCGKEPAGYSTPYPFTFAGKRYVVSFMAGAAVVADVKSGRQVLEIPWKTSFNVNAASPIFHNGHLLLSSGYGTGAALFKLDADGQDLSAKEVWRNKELRSHFQSCVLIGGMLYGGDEQGLKCIEFMTGKKRWSLRRMQHSTVLWIDGHLIVLTEKGRLMIAKATPEKFDPISEFDVLAGRCWTIPTFYNGKLYLRDFKKVVCLDMGF